MQKQFTGKLMNERISESPACTVIGLHFADLITQKLRINLYRSDILYCALVPQQEPYIWKQQGI